MLDKIYERCSKKMSREPETPFLKAYENRVNLGHYALSGSEVQFCRAEVSRRFTLGEISAVLRHSSPETIKHYARYRAEQLLPVIEGKIISIPPRKTESK